MALLQSTPLLALSLALALGPLETTPAVPTDPSGVEGQDPEAVDPRERAAEQWLALIGRDRQVSFTRRTEHDARTELLRPDLSSEERVIALVALGCARPEAFRERPTLESWASVGTLAERQAAILALGELGVGVEAALSAHLKDEDAEIRAATMLAMLLTDRSSARAEIDELATGTGPEAKLASDLLIFAVDPAVSSRTEIGALRFELRWAAARRFGLIDGQAWFARVLEELLERPEFLDRVILGAAAESRELGVKDHLLSALLEEGDLASIQAATRALPAELAALIEHGLWVPASSGVWRVIVGEIEEARIENEALGLLELALEVPELEIQTLFLLVRAGIPEVLLGLETEWENLDPRERVRAAHAWGLAGEARALGWLAGFQNDRTAVVRAAVRLARARLGDPDALAEQETILLDPEHAEFRATLTISLQQVDVKFVRDQLIGVLDELDEEVTIRIATELALEGDHAARGLLARMVRGGLPAGPPGARVVRALAAKDPAVYSEYFNQVFPLENDLEVNVALARALLGAKDIRALQILRRALWSDPFDRSVLAGLLVIRMTGLHGLRDELHRAPESANSRDFRRVGFAIGEWGGLDQVEFLHKQASFLPGRPVLQGAILGALGRRTH